VKVPARLWRNRRTLVPLSCGTSTGRARDARPRQRSEPFDATGPRRRARPPRPRGEPPTQVVADPTVTREIRKDAYERGRADERSKHKRHPLLALLVGILALFGLAVLALYIYNGGSFTETGRDLDSATVRAGQEAREAGARWLTNRRGPAGRRPRSWSRSAKAGLPPRGPAANPPAGEPATRP
jgi:hypothetical protein